MQASATIKPRRRGYTLVELLLALAVLTVLAGVTLPSALRLYADTQIHEVAEQVRSQLAGTRVRAIEGGLAYQFRFEPNGRWYVSVPFEREFEGSNTNASGTGGTAGVGTFTRFAGKLPSGMHFTACCTGADSKGAQLDSSVFGDLPDADEELAGVDWSPAILFYADGSAVDGAFEVADTRGMAIRLSVRGLTGGVKFGELRTETTKK